MDKWSIWILSYIKFPEPLRPPEEILHLLGKVCNYPF
jgi:hypothetical protein